MQIAMISKTLVVAAYRRKCELIAAPLAEQLRWLTEAGFVNVECWYRHYRFCVFSGDVAG